jgi:hypothetical protein
MSSWHFRTEPSNAWVFENRRASLIRSILVKSNETAELMGRKIRLQTLDRCLASVEVTIGAYFELNNRMLARDFMRARPISSATNCDRRENLRTIRRSDQRAQPSERKWKLRTSGKFRRWTVLLLPHHESERESIVPATHGQR